MNQSFKEISVNEMMDINGGGFWAAVIVGAATLAATAVATVACPLSAGPAAAASIAATYAAYKL